MNTFVSWQMDDVWGLLCLKNFYDIWFLCNSRTCKYYNLTRTCKYYNLTIDEYKNVSRSIHKQNLIKISNQ